MLGMISMMIMLTAVRKKFRRKNYPPKNFPLTQIPPENFRRMIFRQKVFCRNICHRKILCQKISENVSAKKVFADKVSLKKICLGKWVDMLSGHTTPKKKTQTPKNIFIPARNIFYTAKRNREVFWADLSFSISVSWRIRFLICHASLKHLESIS